MQRPSVGEYSVSDAQLVSELPIIHVVAGALLDGQGRVLIAQRPAGKHMAGEWEFPGGKLMKDEQPRDGLLRELQEELGIQVQQAEWVASCQHDYPDRRVVLELWMVPGFSGEPQSLDDQALRWVPSSQLEAAGLLPADKPLVTALLAKLAA
ncbi:MAG: 8-oxo-dGTP diphosphatase MutT [Steroidobacteraceae bacterium]